MQVKSWAITLVLTLAPVLHSQTAAKIQASQAEATEIPQTVITGAKVESVMLDPSRHIAAIRIRNLANKDITGFSLAIQVAVPGGASSVSGRINDMLPGIQAGQREGIHSGAFYDDVVNVPDTALNVVANLNVVVFSDATVEFSDRQMLMQIVAERKATADAARQTEAIIRSSSSKAEAMARLTQLWEDARYNHLMTASLLKDHLYNLKNQPGDSEADQKLHMTEYADQSNKEAEFFSLHANLHRRAQ